MRKLLAVLSLAAMATPALAAPASPGPGYSWLSLSAGLLSGDVDVPCGSVEVGDGCSEGGMFTSFGASLMFAGKGALRLRAIRANENTEHVPYETAALVGLRLGRRSHWYGLVGVGSIHHADDDYTGTATGLAWELVNASPGSALELSIHGNTGPDVDFTGISLGVRFGKLR